MGPTEPIAIIGMACIFPQAGDLQAFWNNIVGGVDAVGEPVASWDAERYLATGRIKTPMGGWLKDLYRFDPREFGIMPNSMDGGEPDHFLALRVARDALVDAGYAGAEVDHRDTGIILGHSTYLHRGQVTVIQNNIVLDQTIELLKAALPALDDEALAGLRRQLAAKLPPTNADTAPGLVPNVMTGRIANRLNLKGPNYLVDAACSSSLLAISAAMDELRAGRSRLMLAGGVNASLPADVSTIFTQLGALSARGKVRPFESGSDGTLLGEGLGVVVLKRLADAQADGDRVYAVLRGVGQASDGRGTGLLAPSVEGETLAIRRAYEGSGVDPASVGLIEAHGTGIPLGDRTEIAALTAVFGERTAAQGSIAIGSVKSMISHCIPAAGVAGLIKTALSLHHRVLPPTLCAEVNADLGIDRSRLYVNTELRPWISPAGAPRRAGVDSFGFGGINTHAIVEQAPATAMRPALLTRWPCELCVLSADTPAALSAKVQDLLAALERHAAAGLDEIAAALARTDTGGPVRLALLARSREALAKALQSALPKLAEGKAASWSTRGGAFYSAEPLQGRLAFLFPGEGSQYLGMFADLALHFEEVRDWLDFWRGLYADEPGATRTDIAFPPPTGLSAERRKALEARLHDMDVGSEAVMVGGMAMFSLLESLGLHPDAMLGHSSGESSALAAARALPTDDRAKLADFIRQLNAVYQRVLAEGKIPTGALLAVGALPATMVHETVAASGQALQVAMDNCANQLVLHGTREAVDIVQAKLVAQGAICMPLPFDRGYHTADFGEVSAAFLDYYKAIKLAVPRVPLYSCASGQRFPESPAAVRKLAAAQWSQTVRFRETVQQMVADGVRAFVEVGPSGNLTAFVDDVLADQPHLALATNVRRKPALEQLLVTLAQLWVRRRPLALEKLFERRRIATIDLAAAPKPVRLPGLLDNTLPTLRFDAADRALLRQLAAQAQPAPAVPAPAAPPEAVVLPFIDKVLEHDDARLRAECRLSVHRDAFLRDHVLSGRVSETDPELTGLACVPLMVSLEIMAQGAAMLAGATRLAAIENVRAFDWIALDDDEILLEVRAERVPGDTARIRATLLQAGAPAVSADICFAPPAPLPALPPLGPAQAARWNGPAIYEIGMFHGPLFQSLQHVQGWNDAGIDCELANCSLEGFFEPGQRPFMLTNPVLLDATGQLAACWLAEQVGTDFNCFPSTIERIEFCAPPAPEHPGTVLRGRQQALDPARAGEIGAARRWSFEAVAADGRPLVRMSGLVNVFFEVPHRFYQARRSPLEGWLGAPLATPAQSLVWQLDHLDEAFCSQSNAIFLRMLAHATLGFEERAEWRALAGASVRQRRQWLLGRLALKEAVRCWIHRHTGELPYPSDIFVGHDDRGAPFVDGWWNESLIAAPRISLSHDSEGNIAAVSENEYPVGIDAERLGRVRRPEALAGALTAAERGWLQQQPAAEEAVLRLWCAKEAAAKWCGTGLEGAPEAFEVTFESGGAEGLAQVQAADRIVPVRILRIGNSIVAIAEYETGMTKVEE